jgi:hypothetical protein
VGREGDERGTSLDKFDFSVEGVIDPETTCPELSREKASFGLDKGDVVH